MATSIFFNGRLISVPGSYSEVDASGLDVVGLGSSGIVAVLGTGEGGIPVSEISEVEEIPSYRSAELMRRAFRSGQLREVANMLFSPGKDPDIPGGAVEVVVMKTNPATSSAASLQASAVDQVDLTSLDYGAFTAQVNVEVADGTNNGKLITVVFEDVTETFDDVGGSGLFTLQYIPGTNGYDTLTTEVDAAGDITSTGTRVIVGESDLITNAVLNDVVEILSASAGDVGQAITLFGVVGGVPTMEVTALNGTTVVTGTTTWDAGGLYGAYIDQTTPTAGIVTVRNNSGGTTIFDIPATTAAEGVRKCEYHYVNNTSVDVVSDAASTDDVLLFAQNQAGGAVNEVVTLTGTTPVTSTATTIAQLLWIVTGNVPNTDNVTVTAEAAEADSAVQTTLLKAADYYNSRQATITGPLTRGFVFTLTTGLSNFLLSDLDPTSATDVLDPATGTFYADLYFFIAAINEGSQLISAAKASGATGVPDNTPAPVFLTGGTEGTATFSDSQNALNLLKQVTVNSIVDLSGDPAVAAALDAHCAYMGGIGRKERDGFVGLVNALGDNVTTKDDAKAQIVNLNTRHVRSFAQAITRFNSAGESEEFLPPFGAAILAGMQAGSPVGTSLTFKNTNMLGFRQSPTWNPTDDAEEMIQAGLVFVEEVQGVGRRVVRNVTTHLSSNNIAYTEASVNEAVNFAVFNLRTNLEFIVGQAGFAGTISATRTAAIGTLGLLVDELTIVGYRNLDVTLNADVMEVSVEIAPVIPINFVKTTVHLVTLQQLAEG